MLWETEARAPPALQGNVGYPKEHPIAWLWGQILLGAGWDGMLGSPPGHGARCALTGEVISQRCWKLP